MPEKAESIGRLRRIDGRHNAQVKDLRRAFDSVELSDGGLCAIEGMRIIEEAIRSGLRIQSVFFSASAENRAHKLLPQLSSNVEALLLPDKLFRCRQFTIEEVLADRKSGPLLAVAAIQDPGNLGTILRSAEAFGASGVLLGEGTVSAFNTKVVRASAGSVFRLPIAKTKLMPVLSQLKESGLQLVATSSHGGIPLPQAKLSGPLAIFIGSEGAGLPRELLAKIDLSVAIPHSPQVESLNAGVAASIILYETARQKALN
jgi:RNA methyltransferase, TrmH family